ncbi:MAG: hypothetical protein GX892_07625 [Thermoanaerobacteraceae bacterium]|nr:hypothetical protein [Thermoanaerobacteraceae bacterium]
MHKLFKQISLLLVVLTLISLSVSTAFAAEEKRIDIEDSKNCYITVSGVVDERQIESYTLYIVSAPSTVKFYGDGLSRQSILYLPEAKIQNNEFVWGNKEEEVKFVVKKYKYYGDDKVYDEAQQMPEDMPYYVSGNYAVLTKPGYYVVNGAPEAVAGTTFIIQVTDAAAVEQLAKPTTSKVLINGKAISFEAYNINGNNYFKLRDLAMALRGTNKQFEVGWDAKNNAINLTSGKAYTSVGGELVVSAGTKAKKARPTTSKIYLDGKEVTFTAYNIDGNNYFKLRDIAKAMNFAVTWDGKTNTISINTSASYTE